MDCVLIFSLRAIIHNRIIYKTICPLRTIESKYNTKARQYSHRSFGVSRISLRRAAVQDVRLSYG